MLQTISTYSDTFYVKLYLVFLFTILSSSVHSAECLPEFLNQGINKIKKINGAPAPCDDDPVRPASCSDYLMNRVARDKCEAYLRPDPSPKEACSFLSLKTDGQKSAQQMEGYLRNSLKLNSPDLGRVAADGCFPKTMDPLDRKTVVMEYYESVSRLRFSSLQAIENLAAVNNLLGRDSWDGSDGCYVKGIPQTVKWCNQFRNNKVSCDAPGQPPGKERFEATAAELDTAVSRMQEIDKAMKESLGNPERLKALQMARQFIVASNPLLQDKAFFSSIVSSGGGRNALRAKLEKEKKALEGTLGNIRSGMGCLNGPVDRSLWGADSCSHLESTLAHSGGPNLVSYTDSELRSSKSIDQRRVATKYQVERLSENLTCRKEKRLERDQANRDAGELGVTLLTLPLAAGAGTILGMVRGVGAAGRLGVAEAGLSRLLGMVARTGVRAAGIGADKASMYQTYLSQLEECQSNAEKVVSRNKPSLETGPSCPPDQNQMNAIVQVRSCYMELATSIAINYGINIGAGAVSSMISSRMRMSSGEIVNIPRTDGSRSNAAIITTSGDTARVGFDWDPLTKQYRKTKVVNVNELKRPTIPLATDLTSAEIGQTVLVPRTGGGFSEGVIEKIEGDNIIVGVDYRKGSYTGYKTFRLKSEQPKVNRSGTLPSIVSQKGLSPRDAIRLESGGTVKIGEFFQDADGRIFTVAEVQINGQSRYQLFYRSNSQAVFRLMPARNKGVSGLPGYDKGMSEDALTAGPELQAFINQKLKAAEGKKMTTLDPSQLEGLIPVNRSIDDYLAYTKSDRYVDERFVKVENIVDVKQRPLNDRVGREFAKPEDVRISQSLQPDYKSPRLTYEFKSPVYGEVKAYVYKSKDGTVEYTLLRDSQNRVWFGDAGYTNSPLTPHGLRGKAVDAHELTTPLWEYHSQIAIGYEDKSVKNANSPYGSAWNYIRQMPEIIRWYRENGMEIPK